MQELGRSAHRLLPRLGLSKLDANSNASPCRREDCLTKPTLCKIPKKSSYLTVTGFFRSDIFECLRVLPRFCPAYIAGVQSALALAREDRAAEGMAIINGSLRPISHEIESNFEALVVEMLKQGAAADHAATDTVASMKVVMGIVIALAVLAAILFGMFLTRVVVRQLGGEPAGGYCSLTMIR